MRLCLQRNHTLDVLHLEIVGLGVVSRCKLLDDGTLGKSHIILISRDYLIGILLSRLLNHLEEGRFLIHTINNKGATEDFVTAVFRVDLGKAEHLTVSQLTTEVLLYLLQVVHLLAAQCQTFLFIISLQVFNVDNRFRLAVGGKHLLVQTLIHALQHGVELCVLVGHREVLLDTQNAVEAHILSNLHGICAPRCNHFASWANEAALQVFFTFGLGVAKQPTQLVAVGLCQCVFALYGNHALLRGSEKENHIFDIYVYFFKCLQR